ncbi:hypothetical protein WJX74_001844 [Apatococcus lobatus]|uniref:Uncharacterized protein n=1 Tax=Apatococcus lobatus TaxID=904363 RepID=A0AAW1RGK2_9CHLO
MRPAHLSPVETFTAPWWERFSRAAVQCSQTSASSSQLDCTFSIQSSEHCVLESSPDGTPVRKCERLIRKLRSCPGRVPEVVETLQETRTDTDCGTASIDPYNRESRVEGSLGAEALNRNVGEAFEEFLKFTEGLKHQGSSAEQETLHLEPPGQHSSLPEQRIPPAISPPAYTFFGRLFRRQRRNSIEPPAKAWEKHGKIEVV